MNIFHLYLYRFSNNNFKVFLHQQLNLFLHTFFLSAHGKYDVSYVSNVVVYQEGYVLWIPPAIYKSSCQIDVEYFPFDEQVINDFNLFL
jgi:hypothetical protein